MTGYLGGWIIRVVVIHRILLFDCNGINCLDSHPAGNYEENRMKPQVKFDLRKTIQYWMEGACYDLDVAKAMFEKGKYPYALFMGHLALEKLLKALVVKETGDHSPYTHSLPLLADKTGLKMPQKSLKALARFMEFHFEARYPNDQNKFYRKCSEAFTARNLKKINEVFLWLKKQYEKQ